MSRYDDVVAAERDHVALSSAQGVTLPFFGHKVPSIPLEKDPPEQAAYRRFLMPWFSPRAIAGLKHAVRGIVASVVDELASRGQADLVSDLASPIPPAVIAMLLGLPEADSHLFQDASNRMVRCSTSGDREGLALAVADLFGYLHEQVAVRRGVEPSDLLGQIVNGSIEGRPLTEDEVIGMVHLIVIAGHETTVNGIGHMLAQLARDPELQRALATDSSLVPLVVEEALRYEAPVTAMARTATQPVTLGGACLAQGDKVLMLYSAANRDEAHFAEADHFVANREPNPHLAFGIGVHRCLGEHLARMEMRIVLEEVVARLSQLRLVDGAPLEYTTGQSRGLKSLPVTFTKRTE
ncbi:MAG: cytochrome P450 [Acidimicrobiales bacterium]